MISKLEFAIQLARLYPQYAGEGLAFMAASLLRHAKRYKEAIEAQRSSREDYEWGAERQAILETGRFMFWDDVMVPLRYSEAGMSVYVVVPDCCNEYDDIWIPR
jgi:hypothetical protein